MSSTETVDDADYVVSQSNASEELNATLLIPDASSSSEDASSLTKDNSSFLRIGKYDATEEVDRVPEQMSESARGVLIQTTGGLFFTVDEDAYQQFKSNLDIHIEGDLESTIEGNNTTTISGTNDVNTSGMSRHTAESFTISTGNYTDIQPENTNDIRLKSDNKVDIESDEGVKMAVGSSYYAKISSAGLWETNFADAIDVTTGTSHSRFEGWTTEEYYGGSFSFQIAGAIELSFSVSIEISLLLGISVANIAFEVTAVEIGVSDMKLEVNTLKVGASDVEVASTAAQVTSISGAEVKSASVAVDSTSVALSTGMQINT